MVVKMIKNINGKQLIHLNDILKQRALLKAIIEQHNLIYGIKEIKEEKKIKHALTCKKYYQNHKEEIEKSEKIRREIKKFCPGNAFMVPVR